MGRTTRPSQPAEKPGLERELDEEWANGASNDDASEFFRGGSLGYLARKDGRCLDGITLHTNAWKVSALQVDEVRSSFFEDTARFPTGSVTFDNALLMRDIPHEWHAAPDMALDR